MRPEELSEVRLDFSDEGLFMMNLALALVMFAVALGMKFSDFGELTKKPLAVLVGILSQWLLLPMLTLVLIYLLQPPRGIALGMILVACCPGGNVSNFFTLIAGGNVGLSVSLTGFSSLFAAVLTPLSFALWSGLLPETEALSSFSLSFSDLILTLLLILALPLAVGAALKHYFPGAASYLAAPMLFAGIAILALFIGFAIWKNRLAFVDHLDKVVIIVALHNAAAFAGALGFSRMFRLSVRDSRTISIETGIQNSGLALVIIFGFFDGNGSMAVVAAWWGVWHLIAGGFLSYLFARMKSVPVQLAD